MKILVATTDEAAFGAPLGRLRLVFAERLELEVVSGALYALSWLERQRADLILSSEALADMSGHDFFELVCDDATLRRVPFILLSDSGGDLVLPDHHLILGAGADPTEVFAEALALLLVTGKLVERTPETAEVTASPAVLLAELLRRGDDGDVQISGTLEALTLFDLVVSLGQGKRTGRLVVQVGGTEGTLYLREGRLAHATFAQRNGGDALQRMFTAVHHAPHTPFAFVGGLPAVMPTTIHTSLDKLLLQVAVTLDEQLDEQSGEQAAEPTEASV